MAAGSIGFLGNSLKAVLRPRTCKGARRGSRGGAGDSGEPGGELRVEAGAERLLL